MRHKKILSMYMPAQTFCCWPKWQLMVMGLWMARPCTCLQCCSHSLTTHMNFVYLIWMLVSTVLVSSLQMTKFHCWIFFCICYLCCIFLWEYTHLWNFKDDSQWKATVCNKDGKCVKTSYLIKLELEITIL